MTIEDILGFIDTAIELNADATISRENLKIVKEALEKAEKYKWHDLRKNPDDLPKAEERVQVLIKTRTSIITTFALYENGKIYSEDSYWCWEDICDWDDERYDEEKDDYIIPEGWWEYSLYSEINERIDDCVIKWRKPFEGVEDDDVLLKGYSLNGRGVTFTSLDN